MCLRVSVCDVHAIRLRAACPQKVKTSELHLSGTETDFKVAAVISLMRPEFGSSDFFLYSDTE